jgi:hypothetical protein
MKISQALVLLFFLFMPGFDCAAQEPAPTTTPEEFETRLESLISETGAVIIKGYTRIGSMSGSRGTAYFMAWEVTNARTGHTERGVSIEISDPTRPDAQERAYIDYDELAPLLQGIDYIFKLDSKSTKLASVEAQYQTRGGLVLVTFHTPNGFAAAISTYGGRRARFVLRQAGLAEFRNMVESAKEVLDAPKQE